MTLRAALPLLTICQFCRGENLAWDLCGSQRHSELEVNQSASSRRPTPIVTATRTAHGRTLSPNACRST
jgi:hypothetical protein